MLPLLGIPAVVLALAGAQPPIQPITGSQAAAAIVRQIHNQVPGRLHGGYRGETHCSGTSPSQQEVTASTQLNHWRCKLELRGARFNAPCTAEAFVSGTVKRDHPRIRLLTESRSCHEAPLSSRRS